MLLKITIAYIFGILGGLYKNYIFIVPFLMLGFYVLYKFKIIKIYEKIFIKKIVILLFVFLFGFINILNSENSYNNKYKDVDEIEIIATIISNKKEKNNSITYEIKLEEGKFKNTKLILYIKKSNNINYEYGDKIWLKGTYKKPETTRNYGGFSYKDYLKTKGIYGTINALNQDIKLIKKDNTNILSKFTNNLYTKIVENVENIFKKEEAGLLIAIILGNKDYLDEDINNNFKDSNLSHMLAVSGMHVSYLMLGITFLLNKLKLGKRLSRILTVLLLLFFILLVGGTSSVTRACLMTIYIIVGMLIYRKPDIKSNICLSLIIILLKNPYNLFDIGLQLSYGGTIGIIIFVKKIMKNKEYEKENIEKIKSVKNNIKDKIKKIINYIKQMAIISICANIIIAPLMAYHFSTISITFIISNVLAGPIIGIVVILGFLYLIFSIIIKPIEVIFVFIVSIFLEILIEITNFCSKIPLSKIYIKTPNLFFLLIYYSVIFIILKFGTKNIFNKIKKIGYKKIISVILILIILFQIIKIIPSNLRIYFIDVGQGDSTLIITPKNKTILIDGGGILNSNFDIGEKTLIPYLLDRGITKIDYLIISHFDTDHVGGLFSVMKELKVEKVLISKQLEDSLNYRKFKEIIKERKIKAIIVNKGDRVKIEKNLYIDILWPNNKNFILENVLNNNSIVCKLNYNDFFMLFTGDIEEIAEKKIIEEYNNNLEILKSNILKVGHHGSKTSTSNEFLNAIKPKIALIGVGKNNKFGHPDKEIIERFYFYGIKVYRTDDMGEISIIVNDRSKIKIKKIIQ